METGTFLTDNVNDFIQSKFVPLKYESGRDSEQFMRFGIRATPTYVFLDSSGNEVHRVVGFLGANNFMQELEQGSTAAV